MNSDFRIDYALKNFVWFLVFSAICALHPVQTRINAVEVKKLDSTKENEIINTRYQIIGYATDSQNIEDFIGWVNTMPYFARVDLPIKMQFDEKSKHIYFVMIISLKYSDYAEHPIILDNNLRFDYFKP